MPLFIAALIARSGRASVFGAHIVGDNPELLDRVRRQVHNLIAEALVAGAVGIVVHTVEQEVVEDVERWPFTLNEPSRGGFATA